MRLLPLALAALLLAGCAGLPAKPVQDPLFGLCPQWEQGPGGQTGGLLLNTSGAAQTRELGPAQATWHNRTLDLYRIRMDTVNTTGPVEMRAYAANDHQLGLRACRIGRGGQIVPVVTLDNAATGHEFDVFLSPVTQDGEAAPGPVHLTWSLQGDGSADLAYSITYHYKVC